MRLAYEAVSGYNRRVDSKLEKTHRRADGKPLGRRLGWLLVLIGLALAAYLLLGSRSSLPRQAELEAERSSLLARQLEARRNLLRYYELTARLETDDLFLERLVRERLGLAAPGERVYVIIDRTIEESKVASETETGDPVYDYLHGGRDPIEP